MFRVMDGGWWAKRPLAQRLNRTSFGKLVNPVKIPCGAPLRTIHLYGPERSYLIFVTITMPVYKTPILNLYASGQLLLGAPNLISRNE